MSFLSYFRVPRLLPGAEAFFSLPQTQLSLLCAAHAAALALMFSSEDSATGALAFLLIWGLLNFFFLALLRRPITAGVLSLAFIVGLVLLSRLKHEMIWTTVSFLDVMIVDTDTIQF